MPTQDYISIFEGASFDHLVFLTRVSDGTPIDLTGATVSCHLRESAGSQLLVAMEVTHLSSSAGELRIRMTPEDTSGLNISVPVFDILVEWPDGSTLRTAEVKCALRRGITQ